MDTPWLPPRRPAPLDGRYHRAGESWPLYASLEPDTAWAEWRAATGGAIDPATERRRLWRIDVDELPVLDLRDPRACEVLSVRHEDFVAGRAACQDLARRAQRLGAAGMVVPSAAHPDRWNLVVFPAGFGSLAPAGSSVRKPAPPPAR